MASIKDIAAACGVSIATVSKALRGYTDVSQETVRQVKETAERLGYIPSSIAQAMRTNSTRNLGVVFVDEQGSGLRHEYFSTLLESFKSTAEQLGYDLTLISGSTSGSPWSSLLSHCRYRQCDGVLIACVDFSNPEVQELVQSDIPIVTIDYRFPGAPSVCSDNVHDMRVLTEYVIDQGHTNIAFIHGEMTEVTRQRLAGFQDACESHALDIPDYNITAAEFHNPELSMKKTRMLLSLADPPTCIMYPDDYSAISVSSVLKRKGVRIPDDLSVVGYDGILMSRMITPTLTTMRQNAYVMGRLAAERLISNLEGDPEDGAQCVVVQGSLYSGMTVKQLQ